MGNTLGRIFRVTTWGESHGPGIGVAIDGCPPNLPIDLSALQREMDRRRPGQSALTTQRKEADQPQIQSGVEGGVTTGTTLSFWIPNSDARSGDYSEMETKYRPSHADYTYQRKYGIRSTAGGGRASARETASRVVAGFVAKTILRDLGIEIVAWVEDVQHIHGEVDANAVTQADVEQTPVRCPIPIVAEEMIRHIQEIKKQGDSVGGVIGAVARGVPLGWGSPVFDKLEADLAKAMLSLPAAKGFEVGSGFSGTLLTGSQHNDEFYNHEGVVRTRTNFSGGIQGGISNGEPITVRVAFKPTATILQEQNTVDVNGQETVLKPRGRHDPCVLPRAVVIVEAMLAITLCDHYLLHKAQCQ